MGKQPRSSDPLDELTARRDELRAEIRAGRETLADLTAAIKTARALIPTLVNEMITQEVTQQLEALGKVTARQMDDSVAQVIKKFDDLSDLLMGADHNARRHGHAPLTTVIKTAAFLADQGAGATHPRGMQLPPIV